MSAAPEMRWREPGRRPRARGFTLLEAIVALTIIGIALVPVMSFMGEASRQLQVAAESNTRASAQQTVQAYLEVLNPMLTPTGEMPLSQTLSISWTSQPLISGNSDVRLGGRLGTYRIGFFIVDVVVLRERREWFTLQSRKIGYLPRSMATGGELPSP